MLDAMRTGLGWLLCAAPLAAQTTWIVETGNPSALPTLAAAVAAASDGDVIRIRNPFENVAGLTIDKSLRIVGEGNSGFGVEATLLAGGMQGGGPLTIAVGAGKTVCLTKCALGAWFGAQWGLFLSISDCQGQVTVQDAPSGFGAIHILNSRQVRFSGVTYTAEYPMQIGGSTIVFDRSTITGRPANYETSTLSAPAATISRSTVHCVDSTIRGGSGYMRFTTVLPGSLAFPILSSTLTAAGSSVLAGGAYASGSAIQATSSLLILDPPIAPTITAINSTVVQQPVPSVQPTNFAAGQTAALTLRTPTGSLSALLFGMPGHRTAIPGVFGELWLDPTALCTPLLGAQNGNLTWTIAIPPSPALFATPISWQGAMFHQGAAVLGPPGGALLR